jgi:hypothetical protein
MSDTLRTQIEKLGQALTQKQWQNANAILQAIQIPSNSSDEIQTLLNILDERRTDLRQAVAEQIVQLNAVLDEIDRDYRVLHPLPTESYNPDRDLKPLKDLIERVFNATDGNPIQNALSEWEKLLFGETSLDLENKRRYFNELEKALEAERIYIQTKQKVDSFIETATRLLERDKNPSAAMSSGFTPAEDAANAGSAKHPNHVSLKILAENTGSLREENARRGDIETSAITLGQIRNAILQVEVSSPGTLFPRRDPVTGAFTGTITREDLLASLRKEAPERSKRFAEKYQQEAEQHIEDLNPNAALEVLKKRDQIEEFLDSQSLKELVALERKAKDERTKLELVQRKIDEILEFVTKRASIDALTSLTAIETKYENIQVYVDAKAKVVASVRNYIEEELARAEVSLSGADWDKVVGAITSKIIQQFANVKDSVIESQVKEARRYQEILTGRQDIIKQASATLDEIIKIVDQKSTEASEKLQNLEASFIQYDYLPPRLPRLEEARKRVAQRLGAVGAAESLRLSLDSDDLTTVRSFLNQAQELLKTYTLQADKALFDQLIRDLKLRCTYLEAIDNQKLGNYTDALRGMREVANTSNRDQSNAKDLINEIEPLLNQAKQVDEKLDACEADFERTLDPKVAYETLTNIKVITAEQSKRRQDLKTLITNTWRDQILARFAVWNDPDRVQNPDQLKEDLSAMQRELDRANEANGWEVKLKPGMLYKQAIVEFKSASQDHLVPARDAVEKLEEALRLCRNAPEMSDYAERIEKLREDYKVQIALWKFEETLKLVGLQAQNEQKREKEIAAVKSLEVAVSDYPKRAELYHSAIDTYFRLAASAPNHDSRREDYQKILDLIEKFRHAGLPADTYRDKKNKAVFGREIVPQLKTIELLLTPTGSLDGYKSALDLWYNIKSDSAAWTEFEYLTKWWGDLCDKCLYNFKSFGVISLETLSGVARRYMLDLAQTDPLAQSLPTQLLTLHTGITNSDIHFKQQIKTGKIGTKGDLIKQSIISVEQRILSLQDLKYLFRSLENNVVDQVSVLTTLEEQLWQLQEWVKQLQERVQLIESNLAFEEKNPQEENNPFPRTASFFEGDADTDYSKHTTYETLKERFERSKTDFKKLKEQIKKVNENYHVMRYHAAHNVFITLDRSGLERYGMEKSGFELIDPLTQERYTSFDGVKTFLKSQVVAFQKILDELSVYYDSYSIERPISLDGNEKGGSQSKIVTWKEQKKILDQLVEKGDFKGAKESHKNYKDGKSGRNVTEALAYLQRYSGETPTKRGNEMIRHLKETCIPILEKEVAEANAYEHSITEKETSWNKILDEWEQVLTGGAKVREKHKGRKPSTTALTSLFEGANQTIERARGICPNHRALVRMENNWLYKWLLESPRKAS